MPSKSKPKDYDEVFNVMKEYCQKKNFKFTDYQLKVMAEDCFLLYESKEWSGTKYWPPLAMRWVLNNISKLSSYTKEPTAPPQKKGRTVRDIILEKDKDEHL